jgi:hypothetical protein
MGTKVDHKVDFVNYFSPERQVARCEEADAGSSHKNVRD